MDETTERTVQDVFDDERKNYSRIEEIEEELEMITELKKELKECKKKVKVLEKERKTLQKDLLKEGKLEWIECNPSLIVFDFNDKILFEIFSKR